MQRTFRLWRGQDDLLLSWRKHLQSGQSLTRQDLVRLMQETVNRTQLSADGSVTSLLASKKNSLMIWTVLTRQNAYWADCLALMESQMFAFSPQQRRFLQEGLSSAESWKRLPYLMTEAWHLSTDFSPVYSRLLKAETIVVFTSLVHATLREHPQLAGVLPVTPQVLMRCCELGKDQPEVALQCCRVLALSNTTRVSRVDKEAVAFAYAMLHAVRGQWNVALTLLNSTREVRPSAKRLFSIYTTRLSQWAKAIASLKPLEPRVVAEAITHAPHWSCALRTFRRWESSEATRALLARSDCLAAMGWEASLRLCAASHIYCYALLRPILSIIPDDHPQRMQLHAAAIRPSAEAMYAGTLTRRAYRLVQGGNWAEAIGLLCGCRYYDVALPLLSYAPRGAALPHGLLAYEEAVHRVKSVSATVVNACFEDQLAAALHGEWNKLTDVQDNARLRSLLLARQDFSCEMGAETGETNGVQCFTFQSDEISQLVCGCANLKAQRYFSKVIPRALYCHHFGARKIPETRPNALERYKAFLLSNDIVSGSDACNLLCAMLVEHLRAIGQLTEQVFLKEIARCLASGKVRLAPSERHGLSLAVLRAATHFHRADAAMTARIALSTPSQYLLAQADALEASINALVLSGEWQHAISLVQRATRPYPEFFAVVAYAAPRSVALRVLNLLLRDTRTNSWILLLQDLLHGDTRLAQDELRRCASAVNYRSDRKQMWRWRQRVLGACCALLQSFEAMQCIVRAANISSFCSLDVDEHGLQRLLGVLSWEQALTAINDLFERGEMVEEYWVLLVCTKPSVPLNAVQSVIAWFPYSFLLHSVLSHQHAVMHRDLDMAVKAMVRYLTLVTEYKTSSRYFRPFVVLMRGVLQHFNDDDTWRKASLWSFVRRMFNQVIEDSNFVHLGRQGRKSIPLPLREEGPLAALLVIGFLYQNMSYALQMPVSAAIISRLLRSAALGTSDSQSALHFFKSLKQPTDFERSLLVFALRDSEEAMMLLLNTGRFIRSRPDQVLLWSDQKYGREKWREAIELLSQSPPSKEYLAKLCASWTWAESLRALKLLGRIHGNSIEAEPYVVLVKSLQREMSTMD